MSDRFDRGESRRTVARRETRTAGERSAKLANQLMKLHETSLDKLNLEGELRAVVDRARKVTAMVARRRAERELAGALRGHDLGDIAARIANVEATGSAEPRLFAAAEQWRDRLVAEGLAAAAEFPGGAVDPLPQLIQKARAERDSGKPPGAGRALFRFVREVLEQGEAQRRLAEAEAADAADDD